jgi:hypothetical protein
MKNRIVRVNFHHLRNRTAVQFVTEFIPLVEKYGAETLDTSALYNLFKASSANEIRGRSTRGGEERYRRGRGR